jgi:polysaccharide pyruvyl transferase WcaK-like protein
VGDVYRDDYLFQSKVAQLLDEPEGVLTLGPDLNAAQTKWVISRLRIFAGARTHSTLAAISSCVPTICISYSMKARGIAQDVYGDLDWLIPGQDLAKDPTILRDRFASLLSRETEIRSDLKQITPELRVRARAAAERMGDIIANRVVAGI